MVLKFPNNTVWVDTIAENSLMLFSSCGNLGLEEIDGTRCIRILFPYQRILGQFSLPKCLGREVYHQLFFKGEG